MHPAFYLEEILLNVFSRCSPPQPVHRQAQRRQYTADLAALARTCRTFKEPALDVLWAELVDLSPLARCLPEACRPFGRRYSFSRSLNETEWNTLRGYTHRVRFMLGFSTGALDDNAIMTIFNPPFADPLFPNLRSLYWRDVTTFPVVHVAVPPLTSLKLELHFSAGDMSLSKNFIDSAGDLCPNIKRLRIYISRPHPFDETISRHVCHWTNLQIVDCRDVALNAHAIVHLSSMSTLKCLSFRLGTELADDISPFGSVFVFSNLAHLETVSESLTPVMGFLSHIRLPSVKSLIVKFSGYPSKQTVETYSTTVRNMCPFNTLIHFTLLNFEAQTWNLHQQARHRLTLGDVLPYTAFDNLHGIHINLKWSVSLTDDDLLDLVSASPRIERLVINDMWGWRTVDGITISGLLQLLRKCPSLYDFCLAINTRTYTQIPQGLDIRFPPRIRLCMNIADSPIQPSYVPGLVSVFTGLGLDPTTFTAWNGSETKDLAGAEASRSLWGDVYYQVKSAFWEQPLLSET